MKQIRIHYKWVTPLVVCLFLITTASWKSKPVLDRMDENYHLVYVAERGNQGRFLVPIDIAGKSYQGFAPPDLPGRYFNGVASSHDGKRIAFMRDIEGIDRYSIWRMNADGSGLKRLIPKGSVGLYPSLSADGSHIAFTRRDGGTWEVYVMDFDGNGLRKLTNFRERGKRPIWGLRTSWSADGKQIAYSVSFSNSSGYEVYTVNVDGSGEKQITNNAFQDRNPDFSPDGRFLAFNSTRNGKTRETYVLELATGEIKGLGNVASAFGLDWSPDSKKIAYSGAKDGRSDIYIMNADGSNKVRLTRSGGLDMSPAWVLSK